MKLIGIYNVMLNAVIFAINGRSISILILVLKSRKRLEQTFKEHLYCEHRGNNRN